MSDQIIENTGEKTPLEAIGESLAASLNKQDNPLESAKNESFVSEPFFKEAEEEVKEETKEPVAETVSTPAAELNEDGTPKTIVAEQTTETTIDTDQIPEEKFIGLLNTAINDTEISFNSIEEVKAIIEENKKFKLAENQIQELSQEERARIEVGREFGDFGLFDRVMGIDTSKITPKEALRQAYLLDNLGDNPQFLEKSFERDFRKTYEEDPDEEFSKDALENNGQKAISRIIELQEDLKKRGQISGIANPEDAKKAKIEEDNKWFAEVDNVLSKNDRVTYTLENGLAINIVMDAKDKALIQQAMDSPIDFIKAQITENGKIDHGALFETIMKIFYHEEILNEASRSGAAFKEEKILKEKKNAVIESAKAGDAGSETKPLEQFAANFRQLISNH